MQEIVKLIVDNGIGVICVAYLIYFQSTTMKDMTKALNSINIRLSIIEDNLEIKGDKK
jgi:hypothetical protein